LDGNGKLTITERTVTFESTSNGFSQAVSEQYSCFIPGVAVGPGSPLQLARRMRVTSTPMTDGGSQTVAETEARVPGVTTTQMQIVERKVETVRQIAPGVWETHRQTFGLDENGRLSLVIDENQSTLDK